MDSKAGLTYFGDFCCDINPSIGFSADACVDAFGDGGCEFTSFLEGEDLYGAVVLGLSGNGCELREIREEVIGIRELDCLIITRAWCDE